MELSFEGEITKQDLYSAYSLSMRPSAVSKLIDILVLIIVVIYSIVLLILTKELPVSMILLDLLIIILIPSFWWVPWIQASVYHRYPNMKGNFSGTASAQGLHIQTPHAETNLMWSAYTKYKKGDGIILIYHNPRIFNFFVKRFFKDESDWEEFIKIVEANIKKPVKSLPL